jgi:hypothetical protein
MLKSAAPLLLLAAAALPAPAKAATIRDSTGKASGCALRVDFGSYAMGIDGTAAQAIERTILSARGVGQVTRHRWGREGEYTLCVRMRTAGAAAALFQRLRPLLPPKPHGPITLSLADGRIVRAPRR